MRSIWFVMLLVALTGCSEGFGENVGPDIAGELSPYVSRFVQEGKIRDRIIKIEDTKIKAYIGDIMGDHTYGQCLKFENGEHQVIIDRNFWNRAEDLEKELVIFHELGHCLLDLPHIDDASRRGVCKSIMRSGEAKCNLRYNAGNRDRYLDELFTHY